MECAPIRVHRLLAPHSRSGRSDFSRTCNSSDESTIHAILCRVMDLPNRAVMLTFPATGADAESSGGYAQKSSYSALNVARNVGSS